MSIYRFISFESFLDLVQRKSLAFVSPTIWEDPFEGFIFKALKTKEGKNKVLEYLKRSNKNIALERFLELEHCIRGQCWTKIDESDALWRIYSHSNMSVRIEVSVESVNKLHGVKMVEVNYSENLDLEQEMKEVINYDNSIDLFRGFYNKRDTFKHEDEVRLLTALKEPKIDVHYVSFNHIDNFIKSLLLNPFAPEWFNETLKQFCDINDISYLGKSKIYDFEL